VFQAAAGATGEAVARRTTNRQLVSANGTSKYLNLGRWNSFKEGRISTRSNQWANLTSDYKILGDVRGHKLEFIQKPCQTLPARKLNFSKTERRVVQSELEILKKKGVIVKVEHIKGEFISNIFLREKKDPGKYRLILNLKELNELVEYRHFKMDTLATALTMVSPGCYFTSLDFTDAYYSVAIQPFHRKYLRFEFEGQLWEFTAMPNGLSSGPRVFTKLLKVPLAILRERCGVAITGYLDDTLLVTDTHLEGVQAVQEAADLLQNLGFMISKEKSVVEPQKQIEFLGFIIDSENMNVTMTERKTKQIKTQLRDFLTRNKWKIREVAQILGKLNATNHSKSLDSFLHKTIGN
jgi:hypothetical protein